MKIRHTIALLLCGAGLLTSCSDFTEIDAKGYNLLNSANDLELLLNVEYSENLRCTDMMEVCGDLIYSSGPFAEMLYKPVPTSKSIRIKWDEDAWLNKLPELTSSDAVYDYCYEYIGTVANPVLQKVDNASGDPGRLMAIKAEALLIRAYFHFIAIQRFAPAYNPATAATTIGLAYVTEDQDIKAKTIPLTLEAYYAHIIADLDEAISLNAIPANPVNKMRFGKAALYAVKALTLMSMQKYEEAAIAAGEALKVNGTVINYEDTMQEMYIEINDTDGPVPYPLVSRPTLTCAEDYFTYRNVTLYDCITPYAISLIEEGHVYHDHLYHLASGRDPQDIETESIRTTGEPGYWITWVDLNSWYPHYGLRSSQMYLILAEAAIHDGKYNDAMAHLDKIRENRIMHAKYTPLYGSNPDKATAIHNLKMTAHSEGLLTMWNFVDRKRWNQLGNDWEETLSRTICGQQMTLTPDSKVWVFPIPINVLSNNPNFKAYLNY